MTTVMSATEEPLRTASTPAPLAEPARGAASTPAWGELMTLLAPGVVHQLGNVLFTIQGHAQMGMVGEAERHAVLRATRRGSDTVRLLRALLGDPIPQPIDLDTLLEQVADLARVALREQGRRLELLPAVGVHLWSCDLHRTAPLLLLGLQQFGQAAPTVASTLTIQRVGSQGEPPRIRFGHVTGSGELPFPVAGPDLLAAVAAAGRRLQVAVVASLRASGLELALPYARVSMQAEA